MELKINQNAKISCYKAVYTMYILLESACAVYTSDKYDHFNVTTESLM